jgi:maltose O-acetyltransferase
MSPARISPSRERAEREELTMTMAMLRTQRERMLAGEPYRADDPELLAAHRRAQALFEHFNQQPAANDQERRTTLTHLLGSLGTGAVIKPSFRCDYGFNIHIGDRSFINYEAVFLDCNRISIGADVKMGPGVHLYTATHPLDAAERASGIESAMPVVIGDAVWLGGRVVVCPGVTIGARTVVGAGSVVVKDLPAGVLAVGNPCRVIRSLE